MLSDAPWAILEPLVKACRPKGKIPPRDLRRTLSAILCGRAELGPWWSVVGGRGQVTAILGPRARRGEAVERPTPSRSKSRINSSVENTS